MSEPIKVGDLVVVVGACCAARPELGRIRQIVWAGDNDTICGFCGQYNKGPHAASQIGRNGVPTNWLKRIDPLPENETEKHDEEITA